MWKLFVSRGISNEEKIHLRQKLLSHLREENYQVFPEVFSPSCAYCSSFFFVCRNMKHPSNWNYYNMFWGSHGNRLDSWNMLYYFLE